MTKAQNITMTRRKMGLEKLPHRNSNIKPGASKGKPVPADVAYRCILKRRQIRIVVEPVNFGMTW